MLIIKMLTAAGMLVYAGAGCFAPTIVENDGTVVTLKYGSWETPHEVNGRVAALCAAHDKIARLVDDYEAVLEPPFRYATFDCVSPEEPTT